MSETALVCMVAVIVAVIVASAATFSIRNVLALIVGLLIGLPIAAHMISTTNAKHAHDHAPLIARSR